jgi:hypothetical protein
VKIQDIGVIAVDFDGTIATLSDGDNGSYPGLLGLFYGLGLDTQELREAYEEARAEGFCLERMIQALVARGAHIGTLGNLELTRKFIAWVNRSLRVYSDAQAALSRWAKDGREVVIVTMGENDFQNQKVSTANVPHAAVFTTRRDEDKAFLLQRLNEAYGRVLIVDDKAAVLDAVRDVDPTGEQLVTVRIIREDGKYANQQARHNHIVVSALTEIEIVNKGAAA